QIPVVFRLTKAMVKFCFKFRLPLSWIVRPTVFKQFCGGTTINECVPIAHKLHKHNVKSILDFSAEDARSDDIIGDTMNEILRSIEIAGKEQDISFTVFKPTALCPEHVLEAMNGRDIKDENILQEADRFRKRVNTLCQKAFDYNVPIMIDAEDYAYQNYVDEVTNEMMAKYNKTKAIVYNTLQMYRTDRLEFLKISLEQAQRHDYFLGMKLVRGAYMERERARAAQLGYPSPIWSDKEATDKSFNSAVAFCVEHIDRISLFCGTHNEQSCYYLTQLMKEKALPNNYPGIYFSQLYGMSDNISFNLALQGYNVAKYIPYGPVRKVLPYLIRRAEENSSVAGQTDRELKLIRSELKRRKARHSSHLENMTVSYGAK
ncbi:MAG: proline dehydrogenase family protein, partial [Candidatus Babeliaceae bacterium]|nr:proline dehydrogenase family protein [Candidatus Babeliaceae bacterium]